MWFLLFFICKYGKKGDWLKAIKNKFKKTLNSGGIL